MPATASLPGTLLPCRMQIGRSQAGGGMSNEHDVGEFAPRPSLEGSGPGRVQKPGLNIVKQHFGKLHGKKFCSPCGKWLDVAAFLLAHPCVQNTGRLSGL